MKKTLTLAFLTLLSIVSVQAQRRPPQRPTRPPVVRPPAQKPPFREFRNDFDLIAVAAVLGKSRSLIDFERKLNDSRLRVSNLDFNEDREVDYLRVMEIKENMGDDHSLHLIVIQALFDRYDAQDIATIEIEGESTFDYKIQIVGHPFIYGRNYIVEPKYNFTPSFIRDMFWRSYVPYISPSSWGHYPTSYRAWPPISVFEYKSVASAIIQANKGAFDKYKMVNHRMSQRAAILYRDISVSAYEKRYPYNSYERR